MDKNSLKNILEKNIHKKEIEQSILIDTKTSFFVENFVDKSADYSKDFLKKTEEILNNKEGFSRFILNFNFPLEINKITQKCFSQLKKIFYSEDKFFSFSNPKNNDFNLEIYKNFLFEIYSRSPNSKIYLFSDSNSKKIELKEIKASQILEYKLKDENDFEYIIIYAGNNTAIYFDENEIITFIIEKNQVKEIISVINNLSGIIPVFFVSNEKLNHKSLFVRKNAITGQLSELENLQRLEIFKKIMSPHAFYQFAIKYKPANCTYDNGYNHCEGGYLVDNKTGSNLLNTSGTLRKCPICNSDLGIGNQIDMGILLQTDGTQIMEKPLSFISPDEKILEYSDKFLQDKRDLIYNNILGIEQNLNDKVAHTAEAYSYNSSTREQIILNLKSNFEEIIKKIEEGKLRLNGKLKEKFNLNLGSKFLINSLSTLMSDLKIAKENNIDEILDLKKQIISKKYENDPLGKMRAEILNSFFPDIPPENLNSLDNSNILKLKQIYFSAYINWFENNKKLLTDFTDKKKALFQLEKDFSNFLQIINKK